MNPFSAIEKLINEHGSATILKERINLLKEQFSALEKERDQLLSDKELLDAKILVLESENRELKEKTDGDSETLPIEQEQLLTLLADKTSSILEDELMQLAGLAVADFKYHLGELRDADYIHWNIRRATVASGVRRGRSPSKHGAVYGIKQKGRKYLAQRG